jgi:hypothetical protein
LKGEKATALYGEKGNSGVVFDHHQKGTSNIIGVNVRC